MEAWNRGAMAATDHRVFSLKAAPDAGLPTCALVSLVCVIGGNKGGWAGWAKGGSGGLRVIERDPGPRLLDVATDRWSPQSPYIRRKWLEEGVPLAGSTKRRVITRCRPKPGGERVVDDQLHQLAVVSEGHYMTQA